MQPQHCLFCGQMVQLVHVHGHYQCPMCFTNAMPCCDGDNCDTNNLMNTPKEKGPSDNTFDGPSDIIEA